MRSGYKLFVWTTSNRISQDSFDELDHAVDTAHDIEQRANVERVRVREHSGAVVYETPPDRIKRK